MKTISAKIDDELHEAILKKIDEIDPKITMSKFIKNSLTKSLKFKSDKPLELKDDKIKIVYELNRIGNNLNQISKHCNIKKAVDVATLQELKIIENLLMEIRIRNDL